MSNGSDIDDGWDELLGGSDEPAAPKPAAPKPAAPKVAPPTVVPPTVVPPTVTPPTVVPPTVTPPTVVPPTIAAVPKVPSTIAPPPSITAPTLAAPPPTVGSKPTPPSMADAPATRPSKSSAMLGDLKLPHAAPMRAGAPVLAPAPTVSPRSVLPPPPEFLPQSNSSELPLENEVRDHSGLIDTRSMVPPPETTDTSDLIDLTQLEMSSRIPVPVPQREDDEDDEGDASLDPVTAHGVEVPAETAAETADDPQPSDSDSMEVDIEVSDDALPKLDVRLPSRTPYPGQLPATLSRLASQTPTIPAPTVEAPRPRPRSAPFAEILPAPPRRSLGPWIAAGVATVLGLAVLTWLTLGSSDEPKVDAKPAPTANDEATPSPDSPAPAAPPSSPSEVPEPSPSKDPEPAPSKRPAAHDRDASVITVQPDTSEYDRAAADYEATDSQDALLTMTTSACALHDGPKARAAFRKLVGRDLRSQAMVECRTFEVDVTSNVDGYTGPELLAQARLALEAGDAKTALDKAYASNKVERSSDAVMVQALAACTLGDADRAQRLIPHISKRARPELVEDCKALGVELP